MMSSRTIPVLLFVLCCLIVPDALGREAKHPVARVTDPPTTSRSLSKYLPLPTDQLLDSFSFEDGSGEPDFQGWTTEDLTAQPGPYFHVDDFAGLDPDYAPLAGNQSLWCGVRSAPPGYLETQSTPGYGNNWWQCFDSAAYSSPAPVSLQYTLSFDLETDFDFLYLEYRGFAEEAWTLLKTYTGTSPPVTETVYVSAAAHGGEIRFRFRVVTDRSYSDEDGAYDSKGAVILDDLLVTSSVYTLCDESFENESVGDTATTIGDWVATTRPSFGDYVGIESGSNVLQTDPVITNTTPLLHFFSGSTDTYDCQGHPEQTAVPMPRLDPEYPAQPYRGIDNRAISPWIPLTPSGQGVQPDSVRVLFDVYADNPSAFSVFYQVEWRFRGVETTDWWNNAFAYFGGSRSWEETHPLLRTVEVPEGATAVQIALRLRDADLWNVPYPPDCHAHGPLFDDVRIYGVYDDAVFVTNTLDAGPGSLREAILNANASPGTTLILFDIPEAQLGPIEPASALPAITEPVVIDGYSQPGAAGGPGHEWSEMAPVLEISAPPFSSLWAGLHLLADATVTGLILNGFDYGMVVDSAATVVLSHNFIGPDATGSAYAGQSYGISIQGGSAGAVSHNLISGNSGNGLTVRNASNLQITDNRVGTDRTGSYSVHNAGGILLIDSNGLVVRDNLISGNTNSGLTLWGTTNCTIQGNRIGTDASGAAPLGNGTWGISLSDGSQFNEIGAERGSPLQNVIAFNDVGIKGYGEAESYNHVWGNRIHSNLSSPFELRTPAGDYVGLERPVFRVGNVAGDSYSMVTFANNLGGEDDDVEAYIFSSDGVGVPDPVGSGQSETLEVTAVIERFDLVGKVPFWAFSSWPDDDLWIDGLPVGRYLSMIAYNTTTGRTSTFTNFDELLNTPADTEVLVHPQDATTGDYPLSVTYAEVTGEGNTWLTSCAEGPALPFRFRAIDPPAYLDLSTDATFTGDITICVDYDEAAVMSEEELFLLQYDESLNPPAFVDLGATVDTVNDRICGTTSTLSTVVIAWYDPNTDAGPTVQSLPQRVWPAVPNPFNPSTLLRYRVPRTGHTELVVYNAAGRRVRTLVRGEMPAGEHEVHWDGRDETGIRVGSGVYFYRLQTVAGSTAGKMVLVK